MLKGGWEIDVNIVERYGRICILLSVLFALTRSANVKGPQTSAVFTLLVGFSSVSAT